MEKNRIVQLYPLTKFYLAVVISIAAILVPNLIGKIIVFGCINVIAILCSTWAVFMKRVKNSVGVLFLVLLLIQTFFYPKGEVMFSFWIFSAKKEGLLFALSLGLTIVCVGGCLIWFFIVTPEKDFVLSLEKAGMSSKASYVVLSTLQMIPILKKKSQTIMNAQKSRGVEVEGSLFVRAKVFIPTIIPLVLSSIAGIEERALTLEARGFSSKVKHTYLYDIQKKPIDNIVSIVITLCFIILLIGRFVVWNV